jgi:hypothetical protein
LYSFQKKQLKIQEVIPLERDIQNLQDATPKEDIPLQEDVSPNQGVFIKDSAPEDIPPKRDVHVEFHS